MLTIKDRNRPGRARLLAKPLQQPLRRRVPQIRAQRKALHRRSVVSSRKQSICVQSFAAPLPSPYACQRDSGAARISCFGAGFIFALTAKPIKPCGPPGVARSGATSAAPPLRTPSRRERNPPAPCPATPRRAAAPVRSAGHRAPVEQLPRLFRARQLPPTDRNPSNNPHPPRSGVGNRWVLETPGPNKSILNIEVLRSPAADSHNYCYVTGYAPRTCGSGRLPRASFTHGTRRWEVKPSQRTLRWTPLRTRPA